MHETQACGSRRTGRFKPLLSASLLALIGMGISLAGPGIFSAQAIQFDTWGISGAFDTTVTVGADFRAAEPSKDLIGFQNGGRQFSINTDNGNQNFDNGEPVAASVKVTHEVDARWRNYGFFGRFYYFYDFALMLNEKRRYPLTEGAKDYSGRNIKLLDAYLTADFEPFGRPLTIRLGNQVLSWGESTFIQFGINVVNPVDVSKLRAAGSELRDALLPVPMISLSAGITKNLSVEAFYQFFWEQTEIEPTSTFFSSNDFAGPGGKYIYLGFGLPPGADTPPSELGIKPPIGTHTYRLDDNDAAHMGQGGVAIRLFSPELNDTEFAGYFINYHSRMPYFSGLTGDEPPPYPADPSSILEWLSHTDLLRYGLFYGDYASSAGLIRDYPENIQVIGASFSTELPSLGVAIQGEVSYRPNQPLQIDDVEVLFAALSPTDPYLYALATVKAMLDGTTPPSSATIFGNGQLGTQQFNQFVRGWRRKQVLQPQVTLTKMFGPMFGFINQLVVLGEVGAMWVMDMEDPSVLRYEGPGTFTSGNSYFTRAGLQPATTLSGFATPLSWGYRLAARADILNAIGPVNLQPTLAFSHDVNGTSPSPTVSFVEGRMAGTFGITATYLNRYRLQVAYTNYFSTLGSRNASAKEAVLRAYGELVAENGDIKKTSLPNNLTLLADQHNNVIHDRDYVSIAFSYSF